MTCSFFPRALTFLLLGGLTLGCVASSPARIAFATPPAVGDILVSQNSLVSCADPQSARAMAVTGFFIAGCRPVSDEQRLRVQSLELLDLGAGRLVWMVKARSENLTVATTDVRYIPVPWHDWA